MSKHTIPSSDEAWDDRTLGADVNHVKLSDDERTARIDESVGTQLISIRLQKTLIEDFKMMAALNNGMGYQTLMKQILQRFVDSEKNRMWNEMLSEEIKKLQEINKDVKAEVKSEVKTPAKERNRKAA